MYIHYILIQMVFDNYTYKVKKFFKYYYNQNYVFIRKDKTIIISINYLLLRHNPFFCLLTKEIDKKIFIKMKTFFVMNMLIETLNNYKKYIYDAKYF